MTAVAKRQTAQQIDAEMSILAEADDVIEACGGDMRKAVVELVRLAYVQEAELAELRRSASHGFSRRLPVAV